jgi:Tfp pilus assembly protein PilF
MGIDSAVLQRAQTFRQAGRLRDAEACFRQALDAEPGNVSVMNDLAIVLGQQGKLDLAINVLSAAHKLEPTYLPVLKNLGLAFTKKNDNENAVAVYVHASRIYPSEAEVLDCLGVALAKLKRFEEAAAAFIRAAAANPESSGIKCRLARTWNQLNDIEPAAALMRDVLEKDPENGDAWAELGVAYRQMNRLEDAIEAFDRALAIRPENFDAIGSRALALLAQGDFRRGWREYEFRWKSPSFEDVARTFKMPRWNGAEDLSGRRILLFGEQGVGDIVQFARYVPMLADRGATVYLECQADLHVLLRSVRGLSKLTVKGAARPACDFESPTMSLPLAFGTTVETIPADVPYIAPPPELAEEWAERLRSYHCTKKIGIVWAGNAKHTNDRRRSTALALWAPLGEVGGATFFSMQKGPPAAQWASPPGGMRLVHLTAGLSHFADAAAMISQLDLVITVDTAVAHIAGAMGKPVWNLIAFSPDFRWMLDRQDTPWYPTMRLFRQPSPGNWGAVMESAARELKQFVER